MDFARAVVLKMSTSQLSNPNTILNYSKFIDLVMRIELTRAILLPRLRFAEKFDHLFSYVFIFGNMFRESRGFVAMPVTSSNNFVPFTN